MLKLVLGGLETALLVLGRVFLSAMLAVTVADILLRNVLNTPIPGVVDVVEFSLAITIFAGIAVACWRGAHLAVDLLDVVLSPYILRKFDHVNGLVGFAALSVLAWLCYLRFMDAVDWGDATVDLRIPLAFYWASPMTGFFAAALLSLVRTLSTLGRKGNLA